MSSTDALAYYDKDTETVIITDASLVGLGVVLLQNQKGVLNVERRYSQREKYFKWRDKYCLGM